MEETIKLSFEYSKELEVKRIVYTINRLDWYLNNNYHLEWMSFPKDIDKNNLVNISEADISKAVEKEYDPQKYILAIESLNQLYDPYGIRLQKFIESLGFSIISNVIINLTLYGMGGSYHVPNKVISNISKYSGDELLGNILHEIIHLHIQHLIDKYEVDQWKKETVVNLLFSTAFPDLHKKNDIPIDTKDIETTYKVNFPNIEKIISLV
ncbi:MAG: hypothetical protein V1704_04205 [Candidatus Vogelbacteria bacterium]